MISSHYDEVKTKEDALDIEEKVLKIIQNESRIISKVKYVLAMDIAYSTLETSKIVAAAGVLYDIELRKTIIKDVIKADQPRFAYIPGFLAFREVPILVKIVDILLSKAKALGIDTFNDLILICDGNGTLHPRKCGLACHIGALYDIPSIGVAKNYFVGVADSQCMSIDHCSITKLHQVLGTNRGDRLPLYIRGKIVGYILRTQNSVRPLYISSGYAIDQDSACEIILSLCSSFRQPEPIRQADQDANKHLSE